MEDKKNSAQYWADKINKLQESKYYRSWKAQTKKIINRFCGEDFDNKDSGSEKEAEGYNLLFRNVKIRLPYLLPYIPSVIVDRTNKDEDNPAKYAALLLERFSNNLVKKLKLDSVLSLNKLFAEICGWSTPWLRYEQKIATRVVVDEITGESFEEEYVESENIAVDFVDPKDLFFDPQKNFEKVKWVAHRVYLTCEDFKKKFPEKDPKNYLFSQPLFDDDEKEAARATKTEKDKEPDYSDVCEVYEIWDKISKKIYFYCPTNSSDELLDVQPYPCDIDFPCVMPLRYDIDPRTIYSKSRHNKYLTQYKQVDEITCSINKLLPTLWISGFYAKDLGGIDKAFSKANENAMVGIKLPDDLLAKYPNTTLKDFIVIIDRNAQTNMLTTLYDTREKIIGDIQRGLGIIGLMEGQTNVQEGVQTNKIKGTFGTLWIQEDQKCVAEFLVRFFNLYLSMAAQMYEPETLKQESLFYELEDYKKYMQEKANVPLGQQAPQEINPFEAAIDLIKQNYARDIRLEIATEDTKSYVDAEYKSKIIELQSSIIEGLQQFGNIATTNPEFAPVFKSLLMATVRAQRLGKSFENDIESGIDFAIESIQRKAANPAQPQPDPTIVAATQIEAQGKQEVAKIQAQSRENIEAAKLKAEYDKAGAKNITDSELKLRDQELERRSQDLKAETDAANIDIKQQEVDIKKAELLNRAMDVAKEIGEF